VADKSANVADAPALRAAGGHYGQTRFPTAVRGRRLGALLALLPIECRKWRVQVQFAVGFKIQGKTGHVVVDAEDALIAALKVKMQRPEALIAYVRQQNKRGDTRHPMRRLSGENP
jgi:hypothetical protein